MQTISNVFFPFGLLLIFGILWLYLRARQVKAFNRKRRRATKATARLIRIEQSTNSKRTGMILVKFVLEILPPEGAPYTLKDIEWYIEPAAASKFQEGLVMNIGIDKENRYIIFPAERWARLA